ncbi:MAG: hypothetical protein AB7I50_25440 [Vicinamibacterales bacterium]
MTGNKIEQHRYLLAQWAVERRPDGWHIARSWLVAAGEKQKWEGPYRFPEDAALAIARYLAAELTNRHTARAKFHKIGNGSPLWGMPPPAKLPARPKVGAVS